MSKIFIIYRIVGPVPDFQYDILAFSCEAHPYRVTFRGLLESIFRKDRYELFDLLAAAVH